MSESAEPTSSATRKRRLPKAPASVQAPATDTAQTASETLRLLHELQVHQAELEAQNDELRRTQQALDEQKRRYAELYERSPAGLVSLSRTGKILQINLTGATLLHGNPVRLLGSRFGHLVATSDQAGFKVCLDRVFATGEAQVCETALVSDHQSTVLLRVTATLSLDGQECRAVLLDITESKQTEQALLLAESFANATIDASLAMKCVLDMEGRILTVNQAWIDFYDENHPDPERISYSVGSNYLGICDAAVGPGSDDAAAIAEGIRQVIRHKRDEFSMEYLCQTPTEMSWFRARVTRFRGDSGNVVVAHENITQLKFTEARLKESEERFRLSAEASSDDLWEWDIPSDRGYFNPAYYRMLGYKANALPLNGKRWATLIHSDDRQGILTIHQDCIENRQQGFETEYRLRAKDGTWKWIRSCGRVLRRDAKGRALRIVGTHVDITERKVRQYLLEGNVLERTAQLRDMAIDLAQTEQRERKLVAQDLHDGLSQTLAVARLKLHLVDRSCREDCPAHKELKQNVREVYGVVGEANESVRRLSLHLSPPVLLGLQPVPVLQWLVAEIEHSYGLHVDLSTDGLPEHLEETLLNLIFRVTRELLINVAKYAKVGVAGLALVRQDGQLVLRVIDGGVGFDARRASVPSSNGGYGLFSVRERIKAIGGELQVVSNPGKGTVVTVTVPLVASDKATGRIKDGE